ERRAAGEVRVHVQGERAADERAQWDHDQTLIGASAPTRHPSDVDQILIACAPRTGVSRLRSGPPGILIGPLVRAGSAVGCSRRRFATSLLRWSAAPESVDAAAAICSVLALCSSLDAATSSIAAANDSVPVASMSSLERMVRASVFAAVTVRCTEPVQPSASATAASIWPNEREPSCVAPLTAWTVCTVRSLECR